MYKHILDYITPTHPNFVRSYIIQNPIDTFVKKIKNRTREKGNIVKKNNSRRFIIDPSSAHRTFGNLIFFFFWYKEI